MSTLKSQIIRAALESAQENTGTESLEISQEGVTGAVKGFLLGTAGVIGGTSAGAAVGSVAGPLGTLVGASYGGMAGSAAVDSALKVKREHLKHDIETISQRLADLKNGDIAEAKKKGIKIREEDRTPTDKGSVIKSALLGTILPFYTTYQGHKVEELEIQLAAKITELKIAFAANGHAVESLEDPVVVDNNINHEPALLEDTAPVSFQADEYPIEQADEAIIQLENAALTLESIYTLMDDAQKNGGMTADCRGFAQIALEATLLPLTLPVTELPSMESFGGSATKATSTRVSMEAVSEQIQKLWEMIKAALAKAFEYIVQFIQQLISKSTAIEKKADAIANAAKSIDGSPKSIQVPKHAIRYLTVANQNKDPVDLLSRTHKILEDSANYDRVSSDTMKNAFNKMVDVLMGRADPFEITLAPIPAAFKNKSKEGRFVVHSTDVLPGGKVFSISAPEKSGSVEWAKYFVGMTPASFRATSSNNDAALQKAPDSLSITALSATAIEDLAKHAKGIAQTTTILKDIAEDNKEVMKKLKEERVVYKGGVAELFGRYCQARLSANGKASSMVSAYALTVADSMLAIAAESIKSYKTGTVEK